ncbi:MAG: hypothetical protein COS82_05520 [Zetaproteobacteria bacterium CG06_land_8_20_14_3_00_59_53]|nr:MAG: hypothetical protein AUK36_02865 [Zetaproteobacteria bacterium CG2_30_59_37]PIO89395.1 MAG: hypothetical protein COX56_08650 [Zetaproteobacteria bacterium CG23_combo_of_CG06-09_8_20_14_all_59_86]PIQ65673.1 MAG: hypothetical protein COV97_03250 [Zetaproteobacteria bacterium CG11_big_fil_rev_8_21_14_0_20_59_439]PIU70690.1 MAG: hypothetical protein COS82_05520 [Zetaproteobacteria bacterium CG06_land_8_20_14_3_00_59_53]PIU98038.1 MAG: hypothetical protein COS62_00050 [Zetaproteobacteria bac
MNLNIKNSVAAAVVMMGLAPSAFAGGVQIDNTSLTDILVSKGVLTKSEAKAVTKNNDGKLKMEALFYLNTTSVKADTTTAAGTVSTKTFGQNVDRAYFTAKYNFNDDWMMRFTTDMGNEPSLGKKQNIYLKYAYVEGKLAGKAAVLRLGQSHTPWIDYEQGLWGHRYVAKVMIDQYKFDDSSDVGVGLKGKLADGLIGYWVTETNGLGYGTGNAPTGNQGLDFNSRLGIYPVDGLTLDFQFRDGYRGTKVNAAGVTTTGVKSTLMQAMATYSFDDYRLGFNIISNKDKANSATASTTHGGNVSSGYATAAIGDQVKSNGTAVWATGKFGGGFGAFARYENMTNKLTNGVAGNQSEKLNRYVIGAEYTVTKGIDFSLALDNTKLKTRGGVAANERKDTRFGLYSQVKF